MKFALMFASLSALGLMAAAKDESPPPGASDKKAAAKTVKCRCLINSLGEGDKVYVKDQVFETTAERAEALGDSVEIQN